MQKYWAEMEQEKVHTSNIEDVEKNSHASSFVTKERNRQNEFTKSPAERKLVKKINYTFMPFVVFIIFIQVKSLIFFFNEKYTHCNHPVC
jgi:hypothetical protein